MDDEIVVSGGGEVSKDQFSDTQVGYKYDMLPARSIFRASWWPAEITSKQPKFSPKQMYAIIQRYGDTREPIIDILADLDIEYNVWVHYCDIVPEAKLEWERARQRKASVYGTEAVKLYEQDVPEQFYEVDKNGCSRLSIAGVKYLSDRANMYLRQAQIHENGTYNEKQVTENKNLNVNASMQDVKDWATCKIDDLL